MIKLRSKRREGYWTPRHRNRNRSFSPRLIKGCVAWFDAAKGITFTGSDVSGWADQSGQGNDLAQGIEARRPSFVSAIAEIQNRPAVRFTKADGNKMIAVGITTSQPMDLFIVTKRGTTSSPGNIMWGASSSAAGPLAFVNSGGNDGILSAGDTLLEDGVDETNWIIREYVLDGAASEIRHNNVQVGADTISTNGFDLFCLGDSGTNAGAQYYYDGSVAEVILYDSNLSSKERRKVLGYLRKRHGIPVV